MELSNKDFDRLLQESKFPWWEWDLPSNTVKFNDLKATILGYEPRHFQGRGYQAFTELLHPEDYEATMNAMRVVLRNESNLYQTDYRIRSADQTYRWYMDRGVVLARSDQGLPTRLRGIVIDLGSEFITRTGREVLLQIMRQVVPDRNDETTLTICSVCHKVKAADGAWALMPDGLLEQIAQRISHGLCAPCLHALYPELADDVLKDLKSGGVES